MSNAEITKLVEQLGPILVSVLLLVAIRVLKYVKQRLSDPATIKTETTGLVSALYTDGRITEFITELRVKVNADRVYFDQTHNGDHFASMFPMYKISRTHESCKFGVSYRRREVTAVRVSEITALISPILVGTAVPGSTFLQNTANPNDRIVGFSVEQMGEAYEAFFLSNMNVKYYVGMAVWMEGDLYGFIGVDFTEEVPWESPEFRNQLVDGLCDCASRVGYVIKDGKKQITGRS